MRNLIACRWLLIAAASIFATAATAQDVASITLNPSQATISVDSSFFMGATAFDSADQPIPDATIDLGQHEFRRSDGRSRTDW